MFHNGMIISEWRVTGWPEPAFFVGDGTLWFQLIKICGNIYANLRS